MDLLRLLLVLATVCCLAAATPSSAMSTEPGGPKRLLETLRPLPPGEPGGEWLALEPVEETPPEIFSWSAFAREHRDHVLAVFAAIELEYLYAREVGVSRSPLLFEDPPGIDSATFDKVYAARDSGGFIALHKTRLTQALSLGAIAMTDRLDWRSGAEDVMGLLEAWKFDQATASLVKMVVGRKRPALSLTDPAEVGDEEFARIQARSGGHLSFYSAATSRAFTAMSYVDRVVARRLQERPWARRLSFAGFYGFAAAVGHTRLRQGEHYLTDVLAGAAAGTLIGRSFYRVNHDEGKPERASRLRFLPPAPVAGGGFLMGVAIELP